MDVALATVTVISLTMAFAMGVVIWRLMREERRRADARVAVLMADPATDGESRAALGRSATHLGRPEHGRDVGPVERTVPLPPAAPATPRPARSAGTAVAPPLPEAQSPPQLFAPITGRQTPLLPFLATVAAAAVVVVVATVSFAILSGRSGAPPTDPGAGSPEPVELLSLAHARQGEYLTITGSIRNPSDGIERQQLSVTAIVFDRDGTVVGTGQTPLTAVLPPGSETPFTISLPDADQINRYRIGFVQGQTSVPHIDRRRPNDQARSAAPPPSSPR